MGHGWLDANLVGLVVVISSLTTSIVTIINAAKATRVEKKTDEQNVVLAQHGQTLNEVKIQTNGALSAITAEAKAAKERADALEVILATIINRKRNGEGEEVK